MSRRAAKIDANQPEIVEALETAGALVQSLAGVGRGCPDLLVGVGGNLYVLEVKDGSKAPSAQKLTPDELQWHQKWFGHVSVVNSVDSALRAVGLLRASNA